MVPLLEESGLRAGEDFALAFSPERVDPGRTDYTLRTTPKVVGGLTPACTERAVERLRRASATTSCRSPRPRSPSCRSCWRTSSARSTSRSSTSWRCSPTAWASTSGRSSTPPRPSRTASCASSPGPGMGGHCLPVDPFYLTWKAREYDLSTEFIELAGKVNQQMPYFCLEKIERALNDARQAGRAARAIAACSASSYKAGVGDIRESPALKIIQLLRERGADVALPRPARARAGRARAAQRAAGRLRRRPRRDRHRAPERRSRGRRGAGACGARPPRHDAALGRHAALSARLGRRPTAAG